MTYDKETRKELMEEEKIEDIKEKANEIDDGAFDTWCKDNQMDLMGRFINDNADEYNEFCKDMWNEVNNE